MTNIRKIVKNLIKQYGTNDPFELADALGIWVYVINLGKIKGHYLHHENKKVFFINESLSKTEMLFCIAHELGHAVLHTTNNIYFNSSNTFFNHSKHEIEADRFAAELLISDDLLNDYEGFCIETIADCEDIDRKYINLKFNL